MVVSVFFLVISLLTVFWQLFTTSIRRYLSHFLVCITLSLICVKLGYCLLILHYVRTHIMAYKEMLCPSRCLLLISFHCYGKYNSSSVLIPLKTSSLEILSVHFLSIVLLQHHIWIARSLLVSPIVIFQASHT